MKKTKAVKAWCIKDVKGRLWCLRYTKHEAEELLREYKKDGDVLVRVEIREVIKNG